MSEGFNVLFKGQPWLDPRGKVATVADSTLARWRNTADIRARRHGADGACSLCKRPYKGKAARITLTWERKYGWTLCFNCMVILKAWLREHEIQGSDSQLPTLVMEV